MVELFVWTFPHVFYPFEYMRSATTLHNLGNSISNSLYFYVDDIIQSF